MINQSTVDAGKAAKALVEHYEMQMKKANMKTYKILFNGKRYNTKNFSHYEEARAYVRRLVTRLFGSYSDSYTQYGFKVTPINA